MVNLELILKPYKGIHICKIFITLQLKTWIKFLTSMDFFLFKGLFYCQYLDSAQVPVIQNDRIRI